MEEKMCCFLKSEKLLDFATLSLYVLKMPQMKLNSLANQVTQTIYSTLFSSQKYPQTLSWELSRKSLHEYIAGVSLNILDTKQMQS